MTYVQLLVTVYVSSQFHKKKHVLTSVVAALAEHRSTRVAAVVVDASLVLLVANQRTVLDERFLLRDDFEIEATDAGTTRMTGAIRDAAHLHGVVTHFTSLAIDIVSLARLEPASTEQTNPPERKP